MKHFIFILLPVLLFLSGCGHSSGKEPVTTKSEVSIDYAANGLVNLQHATELEDILCQTWEYKEDLEEVKDLDITSSLDVVYRGYSFFADGSVTKDPRGEVKIGSWQSNAPQKPVTITMNFARSNTISLQLGYLAPYSMIVASGDRKSKNTTALAGDAIRCANVNNDPFYKSNLLWRIKPSSKESNAAIKKRLQLCIHFFILFYDEKIRSHAEKVNFIGLPSCFVWHAGGIFIQKQDGVQKKWRDCFYNDEQAMQAYKIAEKLVTKKYTWPKKGNWLELNLAVLKQMETAIDSLN